MDAAIQSKVNTWLNGNFDEQTKYDIRRLQKQNPDQLADAFYKNLEFGTGGLRGIMGVGTNRMNKYTVGMATQGYLNYLNQSFSVFFFSSRRRHTRSLRGWSSDVCSSD